MMRAVLLVVLLALPIACGAQDGPKNPLRGSWECTAMNIDGRASKPNGLMLDVKERTMRQHVPALKADLATFRYQLLPDGILQLSPPDDPKTYFFGRYDLKEGVLRFVWPGPIIDGRPQPPEDFQPGKGRTVSVWKAFAL